LVCRDGIRSRAIGLAVLLEQATRKEQIRSLHFLWLRSPRDAGPLSGMRSHAKSASMKRLRRILWNALVAMSTLACAMMVILLVRSFRNVDVIRCPFGQTIGTFRREMLIESISGRLLIVSTWPAARERTSGFEYENDWEIWEPAADVDMHSRYNADDDGGWFWRGFSYLRHNGRKANGAHLADIEISVPHWALISILLLPTAIFVRRKIVKAKPLPGQCSACGYDLRATPQRCPECGATPGAAQ